MLDKWSIICPRCHKEAVVSVDYRETVVGNAKILFDLGPMFYPEQIQDYDDYDEQYYEDFTVLKQTCGNCGHVLSNEDVMVGRNNYLAKGDKHE